MTGPSRAADLGQARPARVTGGLGAVGSAWHGLRWWWRGVTGADAYERYAAHLRATHPEAPVPSEREFWREKYADQERSPTTRCC